MPSLCRTNTRRHLGTVSACFLLYFFVAAVDGVPQRTSRGPIAEVDPDAIILRTRGQQQTPNNHEFTSTTTNSSTTDTYDPSYSLNNLDDDFLLFWNLSSVGESEDDASTTGVVPSDDEGTNLEELVLRLEEEARLDEMEMEGEVVRQALEARRSRPSSRLAQPKRKKPKRRKDLRSEYTPLSNRHKKRLLDIHNSYRRKVPGPASNMDEMIWDDELTLMAKKYAKKCIWAHGQTIESKQFKHVGQNLAYGKNPRGINMSPFYLASLWHYEKKNYDIATDTCEPNTLCGHYTQMIWSDTNRVGCATHFCDEMNIPGSTMIIRDALYLVCNYGPGGNIHGKKPYDIGRPCTQCASGSGKCREGLCSDCDIREPSCECMLECQNGGILDEQNCLCSCPAGWMGLSCENVCNNTHAWCGNGWPKEWCFNNNDNNPVEELCPAMCGICDCGGPPCMNGGRKSVTCECDCPTPWSGEDCSECDIKCIHGTLDEATCQCTCDDGWMGLTCSEPCENKHQLCYHGWYPNWCDDEHPYVLDNCPAMCELCKISTGGDTRPGNCRKRCKNGGSLQESACECECPDGWFGDDCSLECRDKFHHCRWSTRLCDNRDYARHYCPVSCDLCSPPLDITE
ncbi:multiple epidermal growth factor-like domains protein 6 [Lytechinus variegatus]|uniref:multiple epidermal growth factor-like domains protein 6 n=1 Tax=Lytechinus variegatus TaxID=7654 RepID=UPI001BB1A5D0|nr:multiple epidermal growth factor-like domains protein 6 [Lytechinus variegatus]XP_041455051.1 multiple epidermal growth factor-like domains protein 6 [Lytechinus variegatus]